MDEDLLISYNEIIRIPKADTHTVSERTMCKQTELCFTSLTPQHLMRSLLSMPLPAQQRRIPSWAVYMTPQ